MLLFIDRKIRSPRYLTEFKPKFMETDQELSQITAIHSIRKKENGIYQMICRKVSVQSTQEIAWIFFFNFTVQIFFSSQLNHFSIL